MRILNHRNITKLNDRLNILPPHLLVILDGAVTSFNDAHNVLRFTNAANGLRELLRETFVAIAPDVGIKTCSWFKADPTSKSGVTRRHRTLFAVYSYLDPGHFPRNFVRRIDDLASQIGRLVGELSALAHVSAAALTTRLPDAADLFDETIATFLELFKSIDSAKSHLREALELELQETLSDLFSSDFFGELDELSSHTRPQDADDIEVEIDSIDKDVIAFRGTGSVNCDMQYGSDGDCRRGDGLEWSDSYPFTFSGEAETAHPKKVTVDREDVEVDTSKEYEGAGDD